MDASLPHVSGSTKLVSARKKSIQIRMVINKNAVKFIFSEKATNFSVISTADLIGTRYIGQIYGGDFAKFCGLFRIYELCVFENLD